MESCSLQDGSEMQVPLKALLSLDLATSVHGAIHLSPPYTIQHMKMKKEEDQWHLMFVPRGNFLILFFPTIHLLNLQTQNQNQLYLGPQFQYPKYEKNKYTKIVGCSNGLLLCQKSKDRVYFVSNPITKDSLQLPPFPLFTAQNPHYPVAEGFLCEPYYNYNGKGNINRVTFNHHRFRVVRFPYIAGTTDELILSDITKSKFEVVVFSSETGHWCRKLVPCPKGFTQAIFRVVPAIAHEGRLYFVGKRSLAVYNPFNIEGQCDTINYPTNLHQRHFPLNNVGVSCGKIRLFRGSFTLPSNSGSIVGVRMSVWELEHEQEWCLLHDVCITLNENIRAQEGPSDVYMEISMKYGLLHPHHGDVVFIQCGSRTFVANLKTKQLHTVGDGVHKPPLLQIISLDLPCWPTPLPSIH